MEERKENGLSDAELTQRLRFWARRVYGGERELLEQAERRIRAKSETNEASNGDSDGDGCGCIVWIVIILVLLKIIGCA